MENQTHRTSLGREIRHYRNSVDIWQDGERVIAFTVEEWAAMVEFVGITGLHRDDDSEPLGVHMTREAHARHHA